MNQNWIVTGSSKGIGLEITKTLLQLGKKVLGISRTAPVEILENFTHLPYDLSNLSNLSSLGLDKMDLEGVVFSHGYGIFKNLEEFSFPQIDHLVNVNLLSTVHLSKLLLNQLKKRDNSFMIYIGSEAALAGKNRSSIYSLTKFGLRGFVQSIRKECQTTSVKVTLIQPGLTRTSFYDEQYFEPKKEEKCAIDPKDIAKLFPWIIEASRGTCLDEIILQPQASAVQFKKLALKEHIC